MKSIWQQLARMAALVLLAGLASAVLARYAPGALVDERELGQRMSEDSLAALRAQKAREASLGASLVGYLKGLLQGDLGYSQSNNAPISALIADRAPETLREIGLGLAGAWFLGLGMAIPAGLWRRGWFYDSAASVIAGLMLSLPAALLAYVCLTLGTTARMVLVLVLAPKIFRFSRNLLVQAYNASHVAMARARGLTELRILAAHVFPSAAPQLLALAAASASLAIGAAIPIEAICDVPGLGRLAWQAAMARDLPLLVNLTMLVALATTIAMAISEALTQREAA